MADVVVEQDLGMREHNTLARAVMQAQREFASRASGEANPEEQLARAINDDGRRLAESSAKITSNQTAIGQYQASLQTALQQVASQNEAAAEKLKEPLQKQQALLQSMQEVMATIQALDELQKQLTSIEEGYGVDRDVGVQARNRLAEVRSFVSQFTRLRLGSGAQDPADLDERGTVKVSLLEYWMMEAQDDKAHEVVAALADEMQGLTRMQGTIDAYIGETSDAITAFQTHLAGENWGRDGILGEMLPDPAKTRQAVTKAIEETKQAMDKQIAGQDKATDVEQTKRARTNIQTVFDNMQKKRASLGEDLAAMQKEFEAQSLLLQQLAAQEQVTLPDQPELQDIALPQMHELQTAIFARQAMSRWSDGAALSAISVGLNSTGLGNLTIGVLSEEQAERPEAELIDAIREAKVHLIGGMYHQDTDTLMDGMAELLSPLSLLQSIEDQLLDGHIHLEPLDGAGAQLQDGINNLKRKHIKDMVDVVQSATLPVPDDVMAMMRQSERQLQRAVAMEEAVLPAYIAFVDPLDDLNLYAKIIEGELTRDDGLLHLDVVPQHELEYGPRLDRDIQEFKDNLDVIGSLRQLPYMAPADQQQLVTHVLNLIGSPQARTDIAEALLVAEVMPGKHEKYTPIVVYNECTDAIVKLAAAFDITIDPNHPALKPIKPADIIATFNAEPERRDQIGAHLVQVMTSEAFEVQFET